ncbi:hypothetical protein OIU77_025746 [Salix suchowensis]|uniref:Thioredoxin domain-containing protein n=1 Tax=Salix suchowensis TaxID=1278906 RepID=A0ABQ9BXB1_9ROSI|nr:hypothetical protein OIU77_025746 [Salix suchowensis]
MEAYMSEAHFTRVDKWEERVDVYLALLYFAFHPYSVLCSCLVAENLNRCLRETGKVFDACSLWDNCGKHYSDACDYAMAVAAKQTFSTLDELVEKSDKPVLVDFYATWCGPCQFMAPILNEVGAVLEDTVQVVKIDTEKYPSIADKYRIEALPTFIIFKDGKPCDRFEGALTKDQLIQRVENSLNVKH